MILSDRLTDESKYDFPLGNPRLGPLIETELWSAMEDGGKEEASSNT